MELLLQIQNNPNVMIGLGLLLFSLIIFFFLNRYLLRKSVKAELNQATAQLEKTIQLIASKQLESQSIGYEQMKNDNFRTQKTLQHGLDKLVGNLINQQNTQQQLQTNTFVKLQNLISQQLQQQSANVQSNVETLNQTTEKRLNQIQQQLENQLKENNKTTATTFLDIQKRLAIIDEAQKRIDSLSENVASLQNVLTDKKTRGTYGEMQLQAIIENVLPKPYVNFQYTLKNGRRADCIIHLPDPNGDIVIDSKFPLESYVNLIESQESDKRLVSSQFKQAIKKHIIDIASKYISPPETDDSAILFIPAESIFAEIHAYHHDLVEFAQQQRVWLTSPTTLMAVLTTAKSVIKDEATRKQSHILRTQLYALKQDFSRFQTRMDNLSKHISQANKDAQEVNISANKITKQFKQIDAIDEWESRGTLADNNTNPPS